jgi:hypothetical protein
VFENRVLRRIFGSKSMKVVEDQRRLRNEELSYFYTSPDIIRVIKSRRMRWLRHVSCMGEIRNAFKGLVGNPEGKRPLGRYMHRWKDNIRMNHKEIGWEDVYWMHLA